MKTITPERQAVVDRIKNEITEHFTDIKTKIQDSFQAKGQEEYEKELAKIASEENPE